MLSLTVQTLDGHALQIEVEPTACIKDVRRLLTEQYGLSKCALYLQVRHLAQHKRATSLHCSIRLQCTCVLCERVQQHQCIIQECRPIATSTDTEYMHMHTGSPAVHEDPGCRAAGGGWCLPGMYQDAVKPADLVGTASKYLRLTSYTHITTYLVPRQACSSTICPSLLRPQSHVH